MRTTKSNIRFGGMLASISVFLLCGVAFSSDLSWIPTSGQSCPLDWSITPDCPTTSDLIQFSGPTETFDNDCVAQNNMGGTATLSIDQVNKTIELWFEGPPPIICPDVWDPVCGLSGNFGPLEAGQWRFFCQHPDASFSISFTVGKTGFTYQGRLIDDNNVADGLYDFQFKLFDNPEAGTQQGSTNMLEEVDVLDGYFTVLLDFGSDVFDGGPRWLEIGIRPGDMSDPNEYTFLEPRQEVTPTPYALYALNGRGDSDWIISGNDMYSGISGNVGIGTTSPDDKLHIENATGNNSTKIRSATGSSSSLKLFEGSDYGFEFLYSGSSDKLHLYSRKFSGNEAVRMTWQKDGKVGIGTTSPAERLVVKVAGSTWNHSHFAIEAHDSTNKWDMTVGGGDKFYMGYNQSTKLVVDTDGDVGIGTSSPGAKLEVTGSGSNPIIKATNTSGGGAGVLGESTGGKGVHGVSQTGDGVYGESTSGWGLNGNGGYMGVKGFSSTGYGVYGDTSSGYAGYFTGKVQIVGNLSITGNLSKGSGSFKIDHPLDPENKFLQHSFVESPDMMNIYNGNATLDENGQAIVELPDYFEALNYDFRYQLTCIGGFAQVYIAEEISNNCFKIAGGTKGMKVSWQVTGVRQDPYAVANRIQVEEDKTDQERGYYIHPKAYGFTEEKGIERLHNPEPIEQAKGQEGEVSHEAS